jgi:hypothetical protein
MKKVQFIILILITAILIILCSCSQNVTGKEPPIITPTPVPPPLTRDANNPEYYYVDKANPENMGMSPRDLTQAENDNLIRLALNVDPVREKIKQGMSYRTKTGWASFNKNSTISWSFYGNDTKDTNLKPDQNKIFFPYVEIGLGTPQQNLVQVVVDLSPPKAVYASYTLDKHVAAPSYVKPLTEEEKSKLIEIGTKAPDFKYFKDSNYNISFQWVAIGRGEKSGLEYDIFEKGIEDYVPLESQSMVIYPAVVFENGSWIFRAAIDLSSTNIVDTFVIPVRRLPTQVPE